MIAKLNIEKIFDGLKSKDPMLFENAFHLLLPIVDEYKNDLLGALKGETDVRIKSKYVELLGYCKDEALIDVFRKELLKSEDDVLSNWCLFALENNPSSEGKAIASQFRKENPSFSE